MAHDSVGGKKIILHIPTKQVPTKAKGQAKQYFFMLAIIQKSCTAYKPSLPSILTILGKTFDVKCFDYKTPQSEKGDTLIDLYGSNN